MNPHHTAAQGHGPTLDSDRPPPVSADPVPPAPVVSPEAAPLRPDPTRFGDWEKNGRCIDF